MLTALDPVFVQLDDRTPEDFVFYAAKFSELLNFYGLDNQVKGTWNAFLSEIVSKKEADWWKSDNHEPHVALFLVFVKLFRHTSGHLNDLPARHLDFFYKEILRLTEKKETPDLVHVLFELNKKTPDQKINALTPLNAGKDSAGKPRVYQLEKDIIVNQAQVAHLRSIYRDGGQLRFAMFANSKDGWGEEFDEPGTAWPAFGAAHLPKAETGIALASHILLLGEGERTITLTFQLSGAGDPFKIFDEEVFKTGVQIFASGEKDWLGPFVAIERDGTTPMLSKNGNGYQLRFSFTIPKSEKSIVAYSEVVLQDHLNTASPVLKIMFSTGAQASLLGLRMDTVKIGVAVEGMSNFDLENDFGLMDASKPFMPFGPQPQKGNGFYIGSQEVFTKNFTDLRMEVKWQGLPANNNFAEVYKNYPVGIKDNTNFQVKLEVRGKGSWEAPSAAVKLFPASTDTNEIPPSGTKYIAGSAILAKPVIFQSKDLRPVLLTRQATRTHRALPLSVRLKAPFVFRPITFFSLVSLRKFFNPSLKEGFLKMTLQQSFGHREYPTQLAYVATYNADPENRTKLPLPSPPYTPMIGSIKLAYKAETTAQSLSANPLDTEEARAAEEKKFNAREVQLFHLTPFGNREEHGYIKRHLGFLPSSDATFLPSYPNAGEFYIGLSGAEPLRVVNLLFQLAEGSADPELPVQKIEWSILSQNHWKPLGKEHILEEYTNHFLRSGIISFYLPKEATSDNSLMDSGLHWVKASLSQHATAVCKVVGVHAQAARAVWANQNNAPDHLLSALPANTIKKLVNEIGPIKKVLQPYASFGGRPKEQPHVFYTRVSERLRHKDRAVTIWDYEHLVLEEFPSVHKAKCLNHTGPGGEFAPGQVTMVLIPQLRNQNAVDILQPKFNAGLLRDVELFLQKKASKFVQIHAQNPDYEEVLVNVKVKFRKGFEAGFYAGQLNTDLIRFLTPWAFEEGRDVHFGGSIHKSRLIAFLEQLAYVDYVEDFTLHLVSGGIVSAPQDAVAASGSRAILVAVKKHFINPL